MPPKSKWRSDDAQHFTLVHRSQRDPLIHDPDAPSRVLAPTQRRAAGKLSRKELEEELKRKGLEEDRDNVGEAAEYGVYFDDTQYDYMQHLRAIGGDYNSKRGGKDEEVDVDVVMLPGPDKGKQKAKAGGELEFKDNATKTIEEKRLQLPREVLASQQEFARDWSRGTEEAAGGLRLDMDPHLRQALEALDDEAFLVGKAKQRQREAAIARAAAQAASQQQAESSASGSNAISFDGDDDGDNDDDDDDFDALFSEVIAGGEYDPSSGEADDEWRQLPPGGDEALYLTPAEKAQQKMQQAQVGGVEQAELSLTDRVALFKQGLAPSATTSVPKEASVNGTAAPRSRRQAPSSVGGSSIFGDAPGKKSKPGSKARHAMSFYAPSADGGATAWSMSSSAMERNAGLSGLDAQFDKMEQVYEEEEEEDDEDEEGGFIPEDFDSILDEVLQNEVIAGRFRRRLGAPDATGAEKLDIIRKEIGPAKLAQWLNAKEESGEDIDKDIESRIRVVGLKRDEWDVETIQTTKTNVSNHPRTLSMYGGSSAASRSSCRPGTLNGSSRSVASGSSSSSTGDSEFESIPKIKVNKRTGLSEIVGWTKQRKQRAEQAIGGDDADEEADGHGVRLPDLSALSIDADDGSGPPSMVGSANGSQGYREGADDDDDDDAGSGYSSSGTETEETFSSRRQETITRPRNESKEDKKARKESAKLEKQVRKIQKSNRKQEFANERKRQMKMEGGKLKDGGAADVRVGAGKRLG